MEEGLEIGQISKEQKNVCSSADELSPKVRKPYTITKQRERWTEDEHRKFLEALKLHGRAWRRIEEHIGSKTAVQIRSHAQKFFSKVTRDSATGGAIDLDPTEIPPPRPKRKPVHPYPRKLGHSPKAQADNGPQERSPSPVSSVTMEETASPEDIPLESSRPSIQLSDEETTPVSLKLFGRTVQVSAAERKPVENQESECDWSTWQWGMMPRIMYCPSIGPVPWWASLQVVPMAHYSAEEKSCSEGEETGSSLENEGRRGFVPYRRHLSERVTAELKAASSEEFILCL